jgi:hypothetical protein
VVSKRASPSPDRRYNDKMSDDYSERDMLQEKHQDEFEDCDSNQYHSDVYVEFEEGYEPGQPWAQTSAPAIPNDAHLSSVRAQSSSSAGTLGLNDDWTA